MPIKAGPGETYTVRRKFFNIAGASFTVFDATGNPMAYCRQKAFRLREDIRLFADEKRTREVLRLATTQVIDFGATYNVTLPSGEAIGSLRRKGLKSSLVRDEWRVFNAAGQEIAMVQEAGAFASIARRVFELAAILFPQTYDVIRLRDNAKIAAFRQHFNPFIFRLGIAITADDPDLDELVLLGAACLIAAIEGRQS